MSKTAASLPMFLLTLFDREQWCPVLQTRFEVADLDRLRALLDTGDDDPNLDRIYYLDDTEAARLAEAFDIKLDWAAQDFPDREFIVDRVHPIRSQVPYLVHTGYELPLLLDGRKKLARFTEAYPPMSFDGEDRFDRWVAAGRLHKEVEIEPFRDETENKFGWQGTRRIYYTTKGEDWRIPAIKLLWDAATWAGWNEYFERLEGMLFGYEDWQNNWWIETGLSGGGFGGLRLCCAVDEEGLAWIKQAGYRALPPIDDPELMLDFYDQDKSVIEQATRHGQTNAIALAVFAVGGKGALELFARQAPPWHLPASSIPELNVLLLRSITIKPVQGALTD